MVKEHFPGYRERDWEVVDYQFYEDSEAGLWFRGPQPRLEPCQYISCLGAAQTLGCLCERPFPQLLAERLGQTTLNLGYGGAGPRFFNRYPKLVQRANRGRLAIVQIMSGRSEDNSRFESRGLELLQRRRDRRPFSSDEAWRNTLEFRYAWKKAPFGQSVAQRVCRWLGAADARRLVAETRANWLESYEQLLRAISVPKVLLWFSQRPPDYVENYQDLPQLFGRYPQLVNRQMVEQLAPLADIYVECVSSRGMPQPLVSRFTGQAVQIDLAKDRPDFQGMVWQENNYYPSPEMHVDAAEQLAMAVARWY